MAQGDICNLKVPDIASRQVAFNFGSDITFHNLAVKQVHLHFQIGLVHQGQYVVSMVLPVDKKSGNASWVDRL